MPRTEQLVTHVQLYRACAEQDSSRLDLSLAKVHPYCSGGEYLDKIILVQTGMLLLSAGSSKLSARVSVTAGRQEYDGLHPRGSASL